MAMEEKVNDMSNVGKESIKVVPSSNKMKEMSNFRKESIKIVPFSNEMKEAEKYSLHKEWTKLKAFFMKRKSLLLEPLDWMGNTVLHVATRSNDPKLLRDLLEMMDDDQKKIEALRKKNTRGNMVLHHAIHSKNMQVLDVLLGYGKDLRERCWEKEIGKSVNKEREWWLLEQQNWLGETPVFRAARCGKIHVLVHLRKYYLIHNEDLLVHFTKLAANDSQDRDENLPLRSPKPVAYQSQDSEKITHLYKENLRDCSCEDSGDSKKSILQMAIACQYMGSFIVIAFT
ncbi:hypothetical protein VNO77_08836 [Canavalia gladiata]|uniref:Uncharacterized protein n=1 Tax=Canavalia gladiata TaxID=3824 RepID=A0AAN9MFE2_CANGL